MTQHLIERDQLTFFSPAPLNDDRDRFLSLIADLYNRRDDYASQLSALALMNLSDKGKKETRHSIISHLKGNQQPEQDSKSMLLWQARLVLKLGELFDREQKDIDHKLASMAQMQDTLLQELREETDTPFSLTQGINTVTRETDAMLSQRLTAWAQIYCLGHIHDWASTNLFITSDLGVAGKIIDRWENNLALSPSSVIIKLPGGGKQKTDNSINPTQLPSVPNKNLQALCTQLVTGNLHQEEITSHIQAWHQELDRQYPTNQYGRARLSLYPFQSLTPNRLFKETFAHDIREEEQSAANQKGCVIGVLETNPAG